jgi:eukaryotic translation initiation factor 2C
VRNYKQWTVPLVYESVKLRYLNGQTDSRGYDPLPIVSALNIVLQQHASKTGVRVGRNRYFFPSESTKYFLGLGVEAWKGYFASVRPTYKQLMVNVNVCMTAFYIPGNLADAIITFDQRSKGGIPRKFIEKVKVTTTHLGYKRRKPIKEITNKPANRTFFNCEELGGRVSVEDYFKRSPFLLGLHSNLNLSFFFCEFLQNIKST